MKAQGLTKETILDYGIKERGFPQFRVGDSIEVSQIVKEGDKERIQKFAGDVISIRHGSGINRTFTVRRIGANNIGVERTFPYYSEIINAIQLVKHGRVRKAKLFYLRKRVGKSARIQELFLSREQKEHGSGSSVSAPKQSQRVASV